MAIITKAVNIFFSQRRREIDYFKRHCAEVQQKQFEYLIRKGASTRFGKESGLDKVRTQEEFRRLMPVYEYDSFADVIDRSRRGEPDVVWPGEVKWFAKSSGTTGSKSKFIPVTVDGLRRSHMRGPKDIMALYCHLYPDTTVVNGKMLTLGGSKKVEREGEKAYSGDLSAILIENTPAIGNILRMPDKKTALIPDFDKKVQLICEQATKMDVRSFAGVPSWNLVMLNRVLDYTGKSDILQVWPHMELFTHGGMDFRPYEAQYRKIIPSDRMRYMETYNASEGFFAIAEEPGRSDMLLMLDYGTYYEFLPIDQLGKPENAVPIEGVRKGVNYAMIITSCNGLWRYMIGDTVEFISTDPYTIKITGRTKHYINAFGEEIVIDNAEAAMLRACRATGAEVSEYSAAPVYMEGREKGAHEWVIEFHRMPDNVAHFTEELDLALQAVNSDYEAKRFRNTTLDAPKITIVPRGTFVEWLRSRGMVGGQNKVPRLFNDRTWVEQLIAYLPEMDAPHPPIGAGAEGVSKMKKKLPKTIKKAVRMEEEHTPVIKKIIPPIKKNHANRKPSAGGAEPAHSKKSATAKAGHARDRKISEAKTGSAQTKESNSVKAGSEHTGKGSSAKAGLARGRKTSETKTGSAQTKESTSVKAGSEHTRKVSSTKAGLARDRKISEAKELAPGKDVPDAAASKRPQARRAGAERTAAEKGSVGRTGTDRTASEKKTVRKAGPERAATNNNQGGQRMSAQVKKAPAARKKKEPAEA